MKSLQAMVQATLALWGRIDVLVNNAGIVSDAQMKNITTVTGRLSEISVSFMGLRRDS